MFDVSINLMTKLVAMMMMRSGTFERTVRELRYKDGQRDEDTRQPGLADSSGVWQQLDGGGGEFRLEQW